MQNKKPNLFGWAFFNFVGASLLDSSYVAGLRSLLSFYDLEFHLIAFLQTLVAFRADRAVVHKYVRVSIVAADKAESLSRY